MSSQPAPTINAEEDINKNNLLCRNCKENFPLMKIQDLDTIIIKCENCKNGDFSLKLGDYMTELKKNNTKKLFCQKKGNAHSNKEAVAFLNNKCYCSECIFSLKEILGDNCAIVSIKEKENDLIKKKCKQHNNKFIYYCLTCKKHLCQLCEDNKNHEMINLEDLKREIGELKIEDKIKQDADFIENKVLKKKN